jgi:hypothetical protein
MSRSPTRPPFIEAPGGSTNRQRQASASRGLHGDRPSSRQRPAHAQRNWRHRQSPLPTETACRPSSRRSLVQLPLRGQRGRSSQRSCPSSRRAGGGPHLRRGRALQLRAELLFIEAGREWPGRTIPRRLRLPAELPFIEAGRGRTAARWCRWPQFPAELAFIEAPATARPGRRHPAAAPSGADLIEAPAPRTAPSPTGSKAAAPKRRCLSSRRVACGGLHERHFGPQLPAELPFIEASATTARSCARRRPQLPTELPFIEAGTPSSMPLPCLQAAAAGEAALHRASPARVSQA